jgi:hypothetical protein
MLPASHEFFQNRLLCLACKEWQVVGENWFAESTSSIGRIVIQKAPWRRHVRCWAPIFFVFFTVSSVGRAGLRWLSPLAYSMTAFPTERWQSNWRSYTCIVQTPASLNFWCVASSDSSYFFTVK